MALSEKEMLFASSMVSTNGDIHAACIAAGIPLRTAKNYSHRQRVVDEIARQRAVDTVRVAEDMRVDKSEILRDWLDIVQADPRNLITHRRINCRHCHGVDHLYQWIDQAEMIAAMDKFIREAEIALRAGKEPGAPPTQAGGFGFKRNARPHPGCTACAGEGFSDIFIGDFRDLSPRDAKLLAGVKVGQGGKIEILMHSKADARDRLAKYLGMLIDRIDNANNAAPPAPVILTKEQISGLMDKLNAKY